MIHREVPTPILLTERLTWRSSDRELGPQPSRKILPKQQGLMKCFFTSERLKRLVLNSRW
jgi:hypothetical protein